MDNLTHTMVGACLGQAGLNRKTALAVPALLIGANLPDLDVLAFVGGEDFQFGFRRGWTHGVVALAVLPAILTCLLLAVQRARRARTPGLPPADARSLLMLSYLATLTHPLLDWFNTYGMRWLMPLDPTWTYGDTLFIVDPWLWLGLAFPLVLATRKRWLPWAGLAVLVSGLILTQPMIPAPAKVVWVTGLVAIVAVRRGWLPRPAPRPAAAAVLVAAMGYASSMFVVSIGARRQAGEWFATQGIAVEELMASPVPAQPFVRDVVGVSEDLYHFVRVGWWSDPRVTAVTDPLPRGDGPVVEAARRAPQLAGFMAWIRYPGFEVVQRPDGYLVRIRDARYARNFTGGFGTAWVELRPDLSVREAGLNLR